MNSHSTKVFKTFVECHMCWKRSKFAHCGMWIQTIHPNCMPRLTQPFTLLGVVKWVSTFGQSSNNKWHPACENSVVRYWHGYLSGVRCRWSAYGPTDAIAIPLSLAPLKSRTVYLSGAGFISLSWKRRPLNGCSSSSSSNEIPMFGGNTEQGSANHDGSGKDHSRGGTQSRSRSLQL